MVCRVQTPDAGRQTEPSQRLVILSEAKEPKPFDAANFSAATTLRLLRFAQDDSYIFSTIASPNSDVLTTVAPGISRSKS
jgi:hypothetical protein